MRKRDEASRLERLREEKAKADAEFREMRRAAAKAAGLPSPPATPSVRSLDSSDGFDSVSDSGRSVVRQSAFFEAVLTNQERRFIARNSQARLTQEKAPPQEERSRCRSPSCRRRTNLSL